MIKMKRIKVLQVITGLGPGGAERLVLDMMCLFDQNRYDVRLLTIVNDFRGLKVFNYPDREVMLFDLKNGSAISELHRMRTFIKRFEPDVIHAHMFHSLVAAVLAGKSLWRSPVICFTSHNSNHSLMRIYIGRFLKKFRAADIIFFPAQHPSLNCRQTELICNGVSVDSVTAHRSEWNPQGEIRVLSVGSLYEQKDPLGLIHSVSQIDHSGLKLEFVGAGPLENEMCRLVTTLGLTDRVIFHGLCSDVRAYMRKADLFVMHSRHEGMPMALLEAGAEAMPVVATPVGSIPEILKDGRGWLAGPEKFSDVLQSVIHNPTAALAAGRQLHDHVHANYSLQRTVLKHERLYQNLASQRAIKQADI